MRAASLRETKINMAFAESYDKALRPVLNAVDAVARLLGNDTSISLPRTVVIGDQSSGKSSVLESLFGLALPRGEGIVTRTPIQVEHRHVEDGEDAVATLEYDLNGERVTIQISDLDDIASKIETVTRAVAGENKSIVNTTLFLKVRSGDLPDLTIVDLPGIVRVSVGDQDDDIESQMIELINDHVKGDFTVNMCVVPVGVDAATAGAIKIARKHDPAGARTMGVMTKIDLVERGIDIIERLNRGEEMLKLGFIPVRNRTPKELKDKCSLETVRANEKRFFSEHSELRKLGEDRRGIDALVQQLVRVQADCIKTSFPKLKKQVGRSQVSALCALSIPTLKMTYPRRYCDLIILWSARRSTTSSWLRRQTWSSSR